MKRTILALAIAGLSVAAYALPPPGGGPPTPIDVNVVRTVMPFPFFQKTTVFKGSTVPLSSECFVVPDTLAYLRVTGLTFDGNASPSFPDFDVLVGATTSSGDYVLFKNRVDEEPVVDLYETDRERFADFVPVNFWFVPGDQICLTVISGTTGPSLPVALDLVISGEGY